MPFTVYECTRAQLLELKREYLCKLADRDLREEPSWYDMANADDLVSDDTIFDEYDGYCFTADDFFASDEETEF